MKRLFDAKFGGDFLQQVPREPGVYLFRDASSTVIYVGKAVNLRRRLQGYRRAMCRKKQRKMRTIVRHATQLTYEVCLGESCALLRENELIQHHLPMFNVAGAYSFLYPYLGLKTDETDRGQLSLCCTTRPNELTQRGFKLFGAYRSRRATRDAYLALFQLITYIAHEDKGARRALGPVAFSRISCFRLFPIAMVPGLSAWLRGESCAVLHTLCEALLDKAPARRDRAEVQGGLDDLREFFQQEAQPLRRAMDLMEIKGNMIAQELRDPLFIKFKDCGE